MCNQAILELDQFNLDQRENASVKKNRNKPILP